MTTKRSAARAGNDVPPSHVAPLSTLIPDAKNANRGTLRGRAMLEDSLQEDGAGRGILLDKHGNVIAGNKTLETAFENGFSEVVIVPTDGKQLVATQRMDVDIDSVQGRRMAIRDNRVAQVDLDFDGDVLKSLADDGLDLSQFWDADELAALLGSTDEPNDDSNSDVGAQSDRGAELQQKWQVREGDVWVIGKHRLLCGDCRNTDDMKRLCIDKVQNVFTSPPYAEQRKDQYGGVPSDEYVDWWELVQSNCRHHMKPDASFFLNIKPHCEEVERSLYVMDLVIAMRRRWDWRYIDEFCWLRSGVPKMVKYHFKNGFEPVYQFAQGARDFKFRPESVMHYSDAVPQAGGPGVGNTNWAGKQGRTPSALQGDQGWIFGGQTYEPGMAYPSNVLKAYSNNESLGHSAAFPVELPEFFILAYSDNGDVWLDPFMGSGTVFVAAHKNNRVAYGIEKMPEHCAIILQRLADMGLAPVKAEA